MITKQNIVIKARVKDNHRIYEDLVTSNGLLPRDAFSILIKYLNLYHQSGSFWNVALKKGRESLRTIGDMEQKDEVQAFQFQNRKVLLKEELDK